MKFIIKLLIFALILITHKGQCEDHDAGKYRLSQAYRRIIGISNDSFYQKGKQPFYDTMDVECVKNILNLPQNNQMIVTNIDIPIFQAVAIFNCSDRDKGIKYYLNELADPDGDDTSCMKWLLKNIEPESNLIGTFEISEDALKKCKESYPIEMMDHIRNFIEYNTGPISTYTCGAVTGTEEYMRFMTKLTILLYGDVSEEIKKTEMEKLINYFLGVTYTTFDCILKRFEDPKAYHINDTFNIFYEKSLLPIEKDDNEPEFYFKYLPKIQETIDKDCVAEKLNLPEIGQRAVLEIEANLVIASAKSKCIKVDPLEFSNIFMRFALGDNNKPDMDHTCAKFRLKKVDPTSKLINILSSEKQYEESCEKHYMNVGTFIVPFWKYTGHVGPLNETTCDVMTDEIVAIITYKTMLLDVEKDEELKVKETKDLFEFATDKLHKFADCILERAK